MKRNFQKKEFIRDKDGQIVIPVEEIENRQLSSLSYLFISSSEFGKLSITSSPDASKRGLLDNYFIKSVFAYTDLFDNRVDGDYTYETDGTTRHSYIMHQFQTLSKFLKIEIGNDDKNDEAVQSLISRMHTAFEYLEELFKENVPGMTGVEIMKSMAYTEWSQKGDPMRFTEEKHHIVVQINECS